MTVDRIDPVLVEKAAIAFDVAALGGADQLRDESWFERSMEAAICVVFDELGLKEDRLANDLCGDVVQERDRFRAALERADELLMAANGALGRAFAHTPDTDRDALEDVRARLAAVSDTTLTALQEPISGRPVEQGDVDGD